MRGQQEEGMRLRRKGMEGRGGGESRRTGGRASQRTHRPVTTMPGGASVGTMRLAVPPAAVDGSAMMGRPPRLWAAPRMKSTCPPIPE